MVFKYLLNIFPRTSVNLSRQTMATLWKLQGILNKSSASELIEHLTAWAAKQHGLEDSDSTLKGGISSLNLHDKKDPSEVSFVLFKNSFLEHVPPIEAYVEGEWFDIEAWNAVVFKVIRLLVENGVSPHDIAEVLSPDVRVGHIEGFRRIEGLNMSYINVRSPRMSWECIEKLNSRWNIDVRIKFKWDEKSKVKLREQTYEIRTLPYENKVDSNT